MCYLKSDRQREFAEWPLTSESAHLRSSQVAQLSFCAWFPQTSAKLNASQCFHHLSNLLEENLRKIAMSCRTLEEAVLRGRSSNESSRLSDVGSLHLLKNFSNKYKYTFWATWYCFLLLELVFLLAKMHVSECNSSSCLIPPWLMLFFCRFSPDRAQPFPFSFLWLIL